MEQMFLTDRKFESRLNELQSYRYKNVISLKEFFVKEDDIKAVNPQIPNILDGEVITVGSNWSGRDKYLWLQKSIKIPNEWSGNRVVGVFDMGNTGAGSNSGFEAMCYVDGEMYQGIDLNHQEVFFNENLTGKDVNLTFRLWSGLEGGGKPTDQEHKIARADLCCLDEKIDDFYYLGTLIIETIKYLEDTNPAKYDLRNALDNALKLIDWSKPDSYEFRRSVHDADDYLNNTLDEIGKESKINIRCVGHTHIDVAWLWRLKHTKEKASRSFSTVLRMMEMFPEYIFLQTQPQLYEYIKDEFPELYTEIKKKVEEGKWEVEGGMWVEADCNIISGESLTRQILIGSKFIKDEFNKDCEYLWLPDVFGYSWALPQVLKKSGINVFMTTKISWNQYNRMPHDTFNWKGIDGTEILTHFITMPEPWSEPGSWFYTYNGRLSPKTVKGTWDAYSEKEMNKELLISYGFGDGGGGVNRDLLETRKRIDKMPGLPNLKTSKAGEYFRDLLETVENTDKYVHTWDGELYLEYHRGTYTSQAYNKKMNRKLELLYKQAEWFSVMRAVKGNDLSLADQHAISEGWKIILTNQFHDIIPGSSIHEVYEDCHVDYDKAKAIVDELILECTNDIQSKENTYTIYNPTGFDRNDIVKIPSNKPLSCKNEKGEQLSTQYDGSSVHIYVPKIPKVGNTTIVTEVCDDDCSNPKNSSFTVNERCVETPFYEIVFNEVGQISRIFDKRVNREVLPTGEFGNVFQMFEDKPLAHDAWDIDIFYQEKMKQITDLQNFEIKENGRLRLVIKLDYKYMSSTISQEVILYSENPRIDFVTTVEMNEQHQLLKVMFPINVRTTFATYDVQYGNVRRPNHWNTSWDQAKFETVGHRFADLSDRNYGVALMNDCKYGYDIKDNKMRLSLIKTATHPDHLQDQGLHEFTYSILPHIGDFVSGDVVEQASFLNEELKVVKGVDSLGSGSFVSLDNSEVEFDAIKKSECGEYIVIRIHDYAGANQEVKLTPNFNYSKWVEGDLRERPTGEFEEYSDGGCISLSLGAFEIKTVLLKL